MELAERIHDFLATQELAVLATCGDAGPYASLVAFAASEDLGTLVFATLRSSTKYRNLIRHSDVSLFFDNRGASGGDFNNTQTLMASGLAGEVKSDNRPALEELFLRRHPGLRALLLDPDCALIRVPVLRYLMVSQFDKKETLHLPLKRGRPAPH